MYHIAFPGKTYYISRICVASVEVELLVLKMDSRISNVNVSFKHYSPSIYSAIAAVADSWENVVERDIICLDAILFL